MMRILNKKGLSDLCTGAEHPNRMIFIEGDIPSSTRIPSGCLFHTPMSRKDWSHNLPQSPFSKGGNLRKVDFQKEK